MDKLRMNESAYGVADNGTLRNRVWHGIAAFSLSILVGCVAQPIDEKTAAEMEKVGRDPDRLLVVDCLLPGQVRQLGTRLTYMTPRRPIKASAAECELRGGEYVAYDRANFATSLKIWLPKAQKGDPEAQTYVGEIYEKGLGTQADFGLAAEWYQRAADQGFSRAQINLGYLYETGLGVQQNLTEAMNWYRKASGIDDGNLEYVSSAEMVRREKADEELTSLRERVVSLQSQLDSRQAELETQRESVASLRQAVEARRAEAVAAASTISRLESEKRDALAIPGKALAEIESLKSRLASAQSEQSRLTDRLAEQQTATLEARRQFASANRELSERAAELEETNRRLSQAQVQVSAAGTDAAQRKKLEAEIKRLSGQLESQQGDLDKLRQRQSASSAEYEARLTAAEQTEQQLKQNLDQRNGEVGELQAQLVSEQQRYQTEIKSLQTRLSDSEQERKQALAQADSIRAEIGTLKSQLATAEQDEIALKQELSRQRIATTEAQRQFEQANSQLAERTAELNRTARSLSAARVELAGSTDGDSSRRLALQAEIERLSGALNRQQRDADALRAKQSAQSARFEAQLASARATEQQLQESLQARSARVESLQVQLDRQRDQFANTVSDLEAELSTAQAGADDLLQQVDELRSQLAAADNERNRLNQTLNEQRAESARLQREFSAVNQVLGQKSAAYDDIEAQLRAARADLNDASVARGSQRTELLAEIARLENDATATQRELQSLRAQQSAESAQIEARLRQARAAERQSEQQIAQRDRELDELRTSLSAQRDRYEQSVADLETRLASSEASNQQLQGDLSTAQLSLQQMQAERSRLDNELARQQKVRERAAAEQRRLTDRLAEVQLSAGTDRLELARLREQITRSERALVTAQQEQLRVQDRLLDVELAMAAQAADNQQNTQQLEQVIAEREQTVEAQQLEIARLQDEVGNARAALADASGGAELEQIMAQVAERESALAYAQSEQERLTDKLMDVQLAAAANDRQNAAQLAELETKLAQSEMALAQKESEVEALEGQVTQAQSQAGQNNADRVTNVLALGPSIEIIEPPQFITRGLPTLPWQSRGDRMDIIGRVDPIDEVLSLKINGQDQELNDAGIFQYTHSKGDTRELSIVAITRDGERNQVNFNFSVPSDPLDAPVVAQTERRVAPKDIPGVNFGNYYALIIGNNNYPQLTNLQSAENDATVIDRILRTKYGFKTELLLNATKASLLTSLNNLRETLTSRDNLLIYYAGHGELDRSNNRGYWLPVDASPADNSNWVSNKSITDIIDSMKAKHVLAVVDSCYSGTLTRTAVPRLQQQLSVELTERWYKVVTASRVRVVLSSGGVKPVYDSLGQSEHSVFAQAFIDELQNNQGILEAYDLYTSVQRRVTVEARQYNVEQNPQYAPIKHAGHEAGEFFFLPGKVASLDLPENFRLPVAMSNDHLWRVQTERL